MSKHTLTMKEIRGNNRGDQLERALHVIYLITLVTIEKYFVIIGEE